ncbi:serine hydrolase domain-containing protein [Tautonia plasticadhaerens]|uniref:D-alanyl-D-alanine-carboxypeptidase/endopeptidase AmpH n=1 Tax=Tautonia plasticadhaerens TaxID=2527974 RepID=A0A518H483_9BACT|nr:serine hydrolase domain-containing protein [Tautonia plasticadhaerens]QDV35661.1 D-alanyl-D-alanine-carboxypeptidase/endopeptidase AmpH precursor [Tautonia plasticadhaerens]
MRAICLFLASILITCGASQASAEADDFSGLTEALGKVVEEAPLPGACLLVVEDGEPIYERCFGEYTPETVVPVASASKWLSAASIMTLVDEGRLSLDDPVSEHLPKFTGTKGEITIRQLLSHTSGLPAQHPALGDYRITMEEAVDRIAEADLVAEPGAEFRYGGVSMQVAGRVAEVVSGQPWREFFRERIAVPCEMPDTQYGRRGLSRNPQIAGGASSTLADYRNFLTMILDRGEFRGRRVLSEEAIRQMEVDQTRGAESKAATPVRLRAGTKYGLGQWLDRMDEQGQGVEVSSPGAFGFRPWIDREHGLLGVLVVEDRGRRARRAEGGVGNVQEAVRRIVEEADGE